MQTRLSSSLLETDWGKEADSILRTCVHCGFCTATCPTYQLTGDELDGPRGRIYLIKQALEETTTTEKTRKHLDRCLVCRSCETTCPSGVRYHNLLQIGKEAVDARVQRSPKERLLRWGMRTLLPYPARFGPLFKLGAIFKPLMPAALKAKMPVVHEPGTRPARKHERKVILFEGCVQSVVATSINAAASRVLDQLGIGCITADGEGCCGAVSNHTGDIPAGEVMARRNIDSWMAHLDAGAEAIVTTASACGLEIREYPELLKNDPVYLPAAQRIASAVMDISEFLSQSVDSSGLTLSESLPQVSFHAPCTLQHGLKQAGSVEGLLQKLGFSVRTPADAHLCCGSAGTYSILQPEMALQLRDNKLEKLDADAADVIATANIGCMMHLQSGTATEVRHWIEIIDASLAGE
ncbi:MAG: glycolate oxidase subunit GlcF [Sedimenticolaceae bacterium]|nr:glycolate oxidase subunit GlcF [Sedimenticolaceae bacterium]